MGVPVFQYKNILSNWPEAIALFKPSTITMLILVSIKNTKTTVQALISNWKWLIILSVYLVLNISLIYSQKIFVVAFMSVQITIDYIIFLFLRPSVLIKKGEYFKQFGNWFIFYFILNFLIYLLSGFITLLVLVFFSEGKRLSIYALASAGFILLIFLKALQELSALFLFDNNQHSKFRVLRRSFYFIIYQMPFIIFWYGLNIIISFISFLIALGFISGLYFSLNMLSFGAIFFIIVALVALGFFFVLSVFLKALITSVYIKHVHEHIKLYLD